MYSSDVNSDWLRIQINKLQKAFFWFISICVLLKIFGIYRFNDIIYQDTSYMAIFSAKLILLVVFPILSVLKCLVTKFI